MLYYAKPLQTLACCALCCVAAATAVAGPPAANSAGGLLGRTAGMLNGTQSRSPASHVEFQRLDLRPPETLFGGHASLGDSIRADAMSDFPSTRHAQLGASSEAADVPGGSNVATLRMESKVQELSRRVPREGFPLARLWETKTALLHVGLSPKGKPGLWLIQKVP